MRHLRVLALVLSLWPTLSRADPKAEGVEFGVNDARDRFKRGVEFFREGSYDAAFAEFSKAYDLAPNYRLLYNLAQVQWERHAYVAALNLFDDYLRRGGNEISPDRRKEVEVSIAQLKSRVAALWVRSPVAGAELQVDGVPVGVMPLNAAVLVNAGVHQLMLRKQGYEPATRVLTIAGNETVRLDLPLAAQRTAAQPVPRRDLAPNPQLDQVYPLQPSAAAPHSRAAFWISFAATAALAGGAVTFGLLARSADRDLDRELGRYPASRGRADDARAAIERDAALCDGLAAGAVVAAGLAVYFALSGGGSSETPPTAAGTRVGANARGLSLVKRF